MNSTCAITTLCYIIIKGGRYVVTNLQHNFGGTQLERGTLCHSMHNVSMWLHDEGPGAARSRLESISNLIDLAHHCPRV